MEKRVCSISTQHPAEPTSRAVYCNLAQPLGLARHVQVMFLPFSHCRLHTLLLDCVTQIQVTICKKQQYHSYHSLPILAQSMWLILVTQNSASDTTSLYYQNLLNFKALSTLAKHGNGWLEAMLLSMILFYKHKLPSMQKCPENT